ncbi:unnamed protein product, partial [Anisakis simplex]|uniref:Uncharacterized protein n=1 Tax=Anisakis simplex TaxID=6269 RepID=A0A0M3K5K1_ANISI
AIRGFHPKKLFKVDRRYSCEVSANIFTCYVSCRRQGSAVMGLSGSKKDEPERIKQQQQQKEAAIGSSSLPLKRRRAPRYPFNCRLNITQRFLPDFFFVNETISSLFVDEDGDSANEFYLESFEKQRNLTTLVRKVDNLRPMGRVKYPIPRLHPDVPFVIWEVNQQE